MYDLNGRNALITGGAHGIGRSIALRLAAEGCDIGLFDLDPDGAEATASEIRSSGRRCVVEAGDVTDPQQVRTGARAIESALGPTDILMNNAGILRIAPLLETPLEDMKQQLGINFEGVFHFCQAVVPGMVNRGRGRVINMSSWLGKHGVAQYGIYCASKFAVIGMTQSLAAEVSGSGVTVNAVCPGIIVETQMRDGAEEVHREKGLPMALERLHTVPVGRLGVPEDVARTVAFLASNESEYMTGQAINVTGGLWFD